MPVELPAELAGAPWALAGPARPLLRALERYRRESPLAAGRAASALSRLLAGVAASAEPGTAWRFSRLTADGFPVELGFTSAGDAVRYTLDCAGPGCPPADRLERALEALAGLGAPLPAPLARRLRRVQAGGRLDYGVWLSGRHGPVGDAYKLYAEVPAGAAAEAERWALEALGPGPLLTARAPVLRMLGLDAGGGRLELYYRADGLEPWEVHRLAGRLGLAGQADGLLELAGELAGRSAASRLPFARAGFSLSLPLGPGPAAFSLFGLARTAIGADRLVRRRLLEAAERHGWPLRHYAAVSEPLAKAANLRPTRHGMLTFAAFPDRPPQLHIGLRPPPAAN